MGYISSHAIVQKIIRDYNIANLSWVEDSIEWVKEAIQYLGTTENKIMVKKDYDITDTPINLPCDLEDIVGIVQDGCFVRFQGKLQMETNKVTADTRPYINNNKIYMNTPKNIKCTLYYYTFLENCDGEPLFQDHIKIKEAITNYVILKLMMRGMKHPVLSYTDAYTLWNRTKDEASNYMKFPAPYEINFVLSEFVNPM